VKSTTQKLRGWPFFSVFSLQKKPRYAWLTPPAVMLTEGQRLFSHVCSSLPWHEC
jgi:hypothetical protein